MQSILYNILIYPIELIVDLVFTLMNKLLSNPGLSIVAVSVAINFLILPMYKRSDALQEKERENQKRLSHWVSHIRKTFQGDERFMMLSEYYRQNDYKPIYALRGSISLLLQIPFFIAAYHYLSNLTVLSGVSFLGITDLARADGLIRIGSFSLNVLPILMTLINFVSGAIYTKGFPLKDKIQLYGMALIFLVFLYGSPSGLVLYWTCNNLFSLLKNIFYKILEPAIRLVREKRRAAEGKKEAAAKTISAPSRPAFFFSGGLFLTLLTGILIPSSVIVSSPGEFLPAFSYQTPLRYLVSSTCIAAGLFIVWGGVLYYLMNEERRKRAERFMWICSALAITNYLFFGRKLGNLSSMLNFDSVPAFPLKEQLLNVGILLGVALLFLLIWNKQRKLIPAVFAALVVSTACMSWLNISRTNSQLSDIRTVKEKNSQSKSSDSVIRLSKSGKNVIVLMLDRAISGYVPYMMKERPELQTAFSGFTYYPNTMSYGLHTLFGAPPLFGGYEYTPTAMNLRSKTSLHNKVDEALRLMPRLFSDAGYEVTVCDPPYAGYRDTEADLSIFNDIPNVRAMSVLGKYVDSGEQVYSEVLLEKGRMHNFFRYSIFKIIPLFLQPGYYDNSNYLSSDRSEDDGSRINDFFKSFSVLQKLKDLTQITDDSQNHFLMMDNESTHNICPLQLPDYEFKNNVNNAPYLDAWKQQFTENGTVKVAMDNSTQQQHYFINMASFLQLGKWFDYLKEEGVYDNTRIILVSDHGFCMGQFPALEATGDLPDGEGYNPLLMMKDFNSTESTSPDTFMTNADVPTLALKDLIQNPVNPFTGNPINADEKNKEPQRLTSSDHFYVKLNPGNVFDTSDGSWYSVHDNIFDRKNWKKEGGN